MGSDDSSEEQEGDPGPPGIPLASASHPVLSHAAVRPRAGAHFATVPSLTPATPLFTVPVTALGTIRRQPEVQVVLEQRMGHGELYFK